MSLSVYHYDGVKKVCPCLCLCAGDVLAFKSSQASINRWIGCPEQDKCFAWGCPGSKFSEPNNRCPHYKFIVSPVNPSASSSRGLRSGDRVILQQLREEDSNGTVYVPLRCAELGAQCLLSVDESCRSHEWHYTDRSNCRHHVIRLESRKKALGKRLRHRDHITLVDDSTNASLACHVEGRKRQRTCQLEMCSDDDCNERHHFVLYKL